MNNRLDVGLLGWHQPQDPGLVMKDNVAVLKEPVTNMMSDRLASDRSYRRNVAGTLLEQAI